MTDELNTNRSFLFGDGFFETFVIVSGKCRSFALHYKRMRHSADLLEMDWNESWSKSYFEQFLLNKSQVYKTDKLRVKIIFYRESTGGYLPDGNRMKYEIIIFPLMVSETKILKAGIYSLAKKSINKWSVIKSTSSLLYVMAGLNMRKMAWDESIILNEHGRVCEGLTSNIFIEQKGIYYTPPLSEGCVDGVKRRSLIKNIKKYKIIEKPLEIKDLFEGQIYFSNSVRGLVKGELTDIKQKKL